MSIGLPQARSASIEPTTIRRMMVCRMRPALPDAITVSLPVALV